MGKTVNIDFEGLEGLEEEKNGKQDESPSSSHEGFDMTPMTDLAFLLLTFFMITTTFARPQIMEVIMPEESDEEATTIKESQTLHIVLADDDDIFWYTGISDPEVKQTSYTSSGIRQLLLQKREQVENLNVLIKPTEKSRYKNLVDILDEMNITGIQKYAVVDAKEKDVELINQA